MKYKNIIDTHTHSIHSFDGNHSVMQICQSALDKGAVGIAITDHCDIDGMDEGCITFAQKQSEDIMLAKEYFGNRLEIYHGVELGQGIYRRALSERLLNSFDFDIVIGSIHNLKEMEDFYFLDYKQFNIKELLTRYFNAVLEVAVWNKTDTIAHLTYPLRYIVAREHIDVDLTEYYPIIDEIFKALITNKKALELNVSGLTMDIKDTLPSKEIIKRYHDMGGKYVTVGTDSHYSDKICENLDKGLDILSECGYTHFTIFKNRKPVLIPIERI